MATAASAGADAPGYQRTIEVGSKPVDVRLHYGAAAPGSTELQGEGVVGTRLGDEARVALSVRHTVGTVAAIDGAQLAASYELPPEDEPLPKLAIVALVDLPTPAGARLPHPGVRATAEKALPSRFFRAVRAELEVRTQGPELEPSSRAVLGTSFRLFGTAGSVELVSVRPAIGSGAPREDLAQIALTHPFGPSTLLRLGLGGELKGDTGSLFRASVGVDLRF